MKKNIYILFIFLCFFTCITTCKAELKFTYNVDKYDGMSCSYTNATSTIVISGRDYFNDNRYINFINDTADVSVKAGTFLSLQFQQVILFDKSNLTLNNGSSLDACFSELSLLKFFDLELRDPNDIFKSKMFPADTSGKCSVNGTMIECIYKYAPTISCINPVTSEAKYSPSCTTDDISFSSSQYFRYFVPLNATKDTGFSISFSQIGYNDSGFVNDSLFCESVLDLNKDTYRFFVVDNNGNKLSNKFDDSIERVRNGCYLKSTINIPVSQSFYTVDNTGNRTGYNFYFRKIDINNPFPSPSYTNGLWNEWYEQNYSNGKYEKNNVFPNIKNSFTESTYEIKGENIQKFNALFNGKDYFEWDHFLSNGHSQNITSNYFNKIPLVDSYGNLGKLK